MKKESVFEKYNCIAVLGGTFNPIHNGHIMLAQKAIEQFDDIQKVIVVPNNKPAYKGTNEIISPKERIDMIENAIKPYDFMEISDIEIKRGGITYTYDTLNQIYSINHNIKIYYIIGADSLFSFDKWYRYESLLGMCTLLCAKRKSSTEEMKYSIKKLRKVNDNTDIRIIDSPEVDISSSKIRKYMSRYGKLLKHMAEVPGDEKLYRSDEVKMRIEKYLDKRVPDSVKKYILDKKLYLD